MSKPAARLLDTQSCPKSPHVGGPIIKASPNVLTNNRAAARVGDPAVCIGSGSQTKIKEGSPNVFINNKQAARLTDPMDHNGKISGGSSNVFIGGRGNSGSCSPARQMKAMAAAKKAGRAYCAVCNCK